MNQLKRASEARLGELKSEMGTKEEEVEEMRYKLSVGGHLTREYHEKNRTLQEEQLSLRRVTERTESAEQLEQEVVSGLQHLAALLNIKQNASESSIGDFLRS